MNTVHKAVALALLISLGARAETHAGQVDEAFDIILNLFSLGLEVAALDARPNATPPPETPLAQHESSSPGYYPSRKQPEARQGLLMSFGVGGGSLYVSNMSAARTGAFDLDFRL